MTDIYFRTDGNSEIATGHLMRCLSIARACVKKSAKVKFIVSDEQSLALLQERFSFPLEFGIRCLHSDYTNMMPELPALSALAAQDNASPANLNSYKPWIFVDSYYVTPAYLLSLRESFRVAYLDDLRSFDCPVDLVINYDTDQDCAYYAKAERRLLGMQYTPLREQFNGTAYTVRPTVEHILLSTGGTDPYAVAEHLLNAVYRGLTADMPRLQSLHYHILTSSANARYDALAGYARMYPNVHVHEGVLDVASLMASCDLAVCAGGTTLCELCAVGVPTVSYLMADNQRTAVETYAALELIPYAGDIRPGAAAGYSVNTTVSSDSTSLPPINDAVISSALSFVTYMSQNWSARQKSSQSMRAFLSGTGANQIACALLS
ncbi:MAG: UDP-2,4-diacetamido-2,4,6-trideoxy-beta-L-altropyranose hydrolase [Lachnospiraceae bacterium]|nr:UDP-2,4-diacetamido-2,4,6-trideoxy-beta-L-altropyranose hydrolase [Lachnospiraceae bacterium]